MIVNKENSDHYTWGEICDGWILRHGTDLMIIEERMPAGTFEERHRHLHAEQFFYVLSGTLTMEMNGIVHEISQRSGIAVPKGADHQARNDSNDDVSFIVISSPTSRGDRHLSPVQNG